MVKWCRRFGAAGQQHHNLHYCCRRLRTQALRWVLAAVQGGRWIRNGFHVIANVDKLHVR
jgi:hypothetical protein